MQTALLRASHQQSCLAPQSPQRSVGAAVWAVRTSMRLTVSICCAKCTCTCMESTTRSSQQVTTMWKLTQATERANKATVVQYQARSNSCSANERRKENVKTTRNH